MEPFVEIGNDWKPSTIFTKSSKLDTWLDSEYVTVYETSCRVKFRRCKTLFFLFGFHTSEFLLNSTFNLVFILITPLMLICGYLSFQMIKHIEEKEKSNKKKGKIILEWSLTLKGQPHKMVKLTQTIHRLCVWWFFRVGA